MSALRDALRDLSDDVFFDLLESEDAYLLVLDVPGVTLESLDVAVEEGRLVVNAEREKDRPGDYRYVEENRPVFVDISLPLPDDASADAPSAEVDRGVLEINIPRRTTETTIDVTAPDRERSNDDVDAEPR
ncbi:Hsp20/alpha crystallin family protein [Natrarchaeobaculum sulfurireducens]|uniref:HSP20 type chaperone n=1 Tax=Natrarchaeobaculum sulfurireducens TaxID=2044521 RepID=A0A346PM89_9EURY|nr:Hsp20/alpha crystallin family protein [Natrarchaeobaculum sulfurireducens]AXR80634.1 HSP20 type chaperone [Natrarchaeobaculum sulfurireducens]